MQINITARDFGGTEFLAQPHRLHLGAQKAEGVDQLEFSLPEQWNGLSLIHILLAGAVIVEQQLRHTAIGIDGPGVVVVLAALGDLDILEDTCGIGRRDQHIVSLLYTSISIFW